MKIGVFGNSVGVTEQTQSATKSFVTKLLEYYNAELVNNAVLLGSTERVAYELKKCKKLDLVLIFYSLPGFYFVPKFKQRDFKSIEPSQLKERMDSHRTYQFDKENIENGSIQNFLESEMKDFVEEQNHPSYNQRGVDPNQLTEALITYNNWFYDYDLQCNRHHASLLLIDTYLSAMKIPVIHCLHTKKDSIPSWFKFNSGIVDEEIQHFQINEYREEDWISSPNRINAEGNEIVFEKLKILSEQAFQKVAGK